MKMKKKIIPIIISAIIFLVGCITAIIGAIIVNKGEAHLCPELDVFSITDNSIGKVFSCTMQEGEEKNGEPFAFWIYTTNYEDNDFYLTYADNGTEQAVIAFLIPHTISVENHSKLKGIVRKSDSAMNDRIATSITEFKSYITENYGSAEGVVDMGNLETLHEKISLYYIEVTKDTNGEIYILTGCVVMSVAFFAILTILFGKKFLIALASIITLAALILAVILMDKFRTMSSVTEVSDGIYKMNCYYDYKGDEFINADISTIDELTEWLVNKHFFGLPIEFDTGNFSCSTFTAATPDGNRLFGRNFDYNETDTLIFYTEPENGYASYGLTDLRFFDIGTENGLDGNSFAAKALMLAAPYVTMDGINEAGVGVGILELDIDEVHQDNGKSDLMIFAAVRGILDNCATVDEAIALLENYDIHSFLSRSYHLFITDKTGKSVIVEWADNDIFIVEDTACTNDVMSENRFYDPEWQCDRYDTIKKWLADKSGVLTEDEAMSVASDASMNKNNFSTEWSCIYNLSDFTVDICFDRNYETKYSFTQEDFR